MATPGFPLPLRNALATLACEALDAADAHGRRVAGARAGAPPPDAERRLAAVHLIDAGAATLLDVHAPWDAAIDHAARALRQRGHGGGTVPPDDPIGRAIVRAAALWNEALFFEVHEVLEVVWQREAGERRQALQGLIQIAVAWHHLAHGNPRGARTLLREGRARLAAAPPGTLPLLDGGALLAATEPAESALAASGAERSRPACRSAAERGPRRPSARAPALVLDPAVRVAQRSTRRGPHQSSRIARLADASSATPRAALAQRVIERAVERPGR
jgi:hypothetical protein